MGFGCIILQNNGNYWIALVNGPIFQVYKLALFSLRGLLGTTVNERFHRFINARLKGVRIIGWNLFEVYLLWLIEDWNQLLVQYIMFLLVCIQYNQIAHLIFRFQTKSKEVEIALAQWSAESLSAKCSMYAGGLRQSAWYNFVKHYEGR